MIDDPFRSRLPIFVEPIPSLYKTLGRSPNQVTFIAFLLGTASSYLVAQQNFIFATIVWWIGRSFDGTDGIYARATMQTTAFGAYFDILADIASYSMMIIRFSIAFPGPQLLWISILFLYALYIQEHFRWEAWKK